MLQWSSARHLSGVRAVVIGRIVMRLLTFILCAAEFTIDDGALLAASRIEQTATVGAEQQ